MLKKFLISLEKDKYRRDLFFAQPYTSDVQIVQAFNSLDVSISQLTNLFDFDKFLKLYGRQPYKGEVGCCLSHISIYKKIWGDDEIALDDYVLIFEDDALLCENFFQELDQLLKTDINEDFVILGNSKIPTFNSYLLELNTPTTLKFLRKKIPHTRKFYSYPYRPYYAGTVTYLFKKGSIEKLISNTPFWLADDFLFFDKFFDLKAVVVRPLMAIENPQINSNLNNSRHVIKFEKAKMIFKYPFKKCLAIIK